MKFSIACALLIAFQAANAEDSSQLAEQRRKERAKISFWCETGRAPLAQSLEGLNIVPTKSCTFGSPLDSKITPLILEPPFLNPALTFDDLRQFTLKSGGQIESESANAVQFRLNGDRFIANRIVNKQLKDTNMRLGFYPADWGPTFISIAGSSAPAVRTLAEAMQANASGVFSWPNPNYNEEMAIWPRMTGGPRPYLPLELVPKCRVKEAWNPSNKSILLVGDMHTAKESKYFLDMIQTIPVAFAALEISRDREVDLKAFLEAKTPAEENPFLDKMVGRLPKDLKEDFRGIFRALKRRRIQIVLMDYRESYYNFPFTNTAFQGAIIAQRNKLWVDRVPSDWQGSGVMFAGLSHFTDVPGHDVQNFLTERFPGLTMGLVDPLENCN